MGPDESGILCRIEGKPLVICLGCAKERGIPIPNRQTFLLAR